MIFATNNIVAPEELIFSLQKRKLLGFAFKVDFAKAFDSLDLTFLLDIHVPWDLDPIWYACFKHGLC